MDHTVVPGYSYAVTASEDCTLTAANGWKLELKAGIQQHFTAQFSTFSSSAPISLNVNFNAAPAAGSAGGVSGQYVTIQVRGVKKVDKPVYGQIKCERYCTTTSGWSIIDPQGPVADWMVDCGVLCTPGWLYRELWEHPSGDDVKEEAMVGWEFVLLAGEEDILLRNVRDMASVLSEITGGVNTLHYKLIYHD